MSKNVAQTISIFTASIHFSTQARTYGEGVGGVGVGCVWGVEWGLGGG